jgi:hypothetical protein
LRSRPIIGPTPASSWSSATSRTRRWPTCHPAASLALAVLAHNIGRWTLNAAGSDFADATVGSLRRKLITMPARLITSARRLRLRAPTGWPWADALTDALTAIRAIPAPG